MRATVLVTVVVLAMLPAAAGRSFADPVPDRVGIYFDAGATQPVAWFGPFSVVTMYITVTTPTFENIYGWQAAVRGVDPDAMVIAGTTITGGSTITGPELQYDVALASPLVAQPTTVLASITGLMSVEAPMICLRLTGIDNPALPDTLPLIWTQPDQPSAIQVAPMYFNGVVAAINESPIPEGPNCAWPVAVERSSWAALKLLYR